jgi:precorrin-8X/cobalt-precorrin-8 methylmutase
MNYLKDGNKIEEKSFEIITKELGDKTFEEKTGKVIKRMIHATADFEYAEITEIHKDAIEKGMEALKNGSFIYTDTKMAMSGINKKTLAKFGGEVYCLVDDEEVIKEAQERGVTRSIVAMEKACLNEKTKIFVIGNAPTALFTLVEFIKEGKVKPELIVGVPVGFVGAAESKETVRDINIPYIITRGRKGGSTIAAAIINALLYQC